jgi:hypothetical protein
MDRSSNYWVQDPNLTGIGTIIQLAMLVMFGTWVGALVRIARLKRWGWFIGVLISQLIGLGIAGMVAYGVAGPDEPSVSRPTVS